jgi:periplasmic divalent cation tolerance protein
MSPRPLVVLVTAPSAEGAARIGRVLVEERLAACVNVLPGVTSIFFWEGKLEESPEALMLIKTDPQRYEALERRVLELHPYSVPEVLALPVEAGSPAYLSWVSESTAREGR